MELAGVSSQYAALGERIRRRVTGVLDGGRYIGGREVESLEAALAAFAEVRRCVTCASGTDALLLLLRAAGIGEGDAVLCPSFTFAATAEAIVLAGATPVFCDIDESLTLCAASAQEQLRRVRREARLRPKAILAADLCGEPCGRGALRAFARREGLYFFADAAQSFGARWQGAGALASCDAAATSFFPTKPLGACGDGGAVLTNDGALADTVRSLAWHGAGADKYDNVRVGTNSRLDAVQAAVLSVKLEAFPEELFRRKAAAELYDLYLPDWICRPVSRPGAESALALYTVRFSTQRLRDDAMAHLNTLGIPSAIYYKKPLHRQKAFARYAAESLPASELAPELVLSLPMHAYLTAQEVREVCRALGEVTPCDTL